jgi:type I restriction enzyme S subunit
MTSETKPETGYTAIFRSANADEDVYLNSFCVCYRSFDKEEHPPEVIHALMKSKHFRSKIWRISQGSTRINLSRSELGKLDLELPLQTQKRLTTSLQLTVTLVV